MNMQPVNTYNNIHGVQPIANVTSRYSTIHSANDMPINHHTNFVDEPSSSHRRYNNLTPNYMKNVYSPSLAPSSGSTTENFLKAKSILSSNFRHNEKATRYQMISEIDLKLYKMQKNIDLYI